MLLRHKNSMDSLVSGMPTVVLCLLFTLLCIAISLAGMYLFRRWRKTETLKPNHDVTGLIFGASSLIYSLILAFVIVAVWEDYEELNDVIVHEADKLQGIIVHSIELPDSVASMVQREVKDYAKAVVEHQWQSILPSDDHISLLQLRKYLLKISPSDDLEERVLGILDEEISDADDFRRVRLSHFHSHVPGLVWMVLIAGSILTILFSFLFFVSPRALHYLLVALMTCMIAMSLFLVYILDHPFLKAAHVSSMPFQALYQQF